MTSSAVVGSSAISSVGLQASAIAIITRWRMPPESWCGYSPARRSGSGMSTRASISIACRRAAARPRPLMQPHDLGDLLADGEHRVEAGHRLLEDHADLVAAHARASPARTARSRSRRAGARTARGPRRSRPAASAPAA